MFLKVFKDTTEQQLQPDARHVEGLEDLPCFEVPEAGLFMFWDHELRMPWQRDVRFIKEQRTELRATAYLRLVENRWQKSESTYLQPEWITRSFKPELSELLEPMIVACDGSVGRKQGAADNTALVGARQIAKYLPDGKLDVRYRTCIARIWEIPEGQKIDLDDTLAAELKSLALKNLIIWPVYYDPYQLHQVMLNFVKWCKEQGIQDAAVEEFNQGVDRLLADTLLFKLYRDDQIDNYEAPLLRSNLEAARAVEDKQQRFRIVKQTVAKGAAQHTFKVDGAVAQSMSVYKASLLPPPPPPPTSRVIRRSASQILGV